jgi:hypothetical protein
VNEAPLPEGSSASGVEQFSSRTRSDDYVLEGQEAGEVGRRALFRVTLAKAPEPSRRIRFTPTASGGDGVFQPGTLELSGKTTSATFAYVPRTWGVRELALTNDQGFADPAGLRFVAKVQVGSSGTAPSGNRCPDLGGFDFFANGPWWRELGREVIDDVASPRSEELIAKLGKATLRPDWSTSKSKGGNGIYGIPLNVVPGTQPLRTLILGSYAKESDPGPVPFFPAMSIESWYDPSGKPPAPKQVTGDHHGLVLQRDEATGGIRRIYEYYQVESNDGGMTWQSPGGAQFDPAGAGLRPDSWTSADAGGLPMVPLLVRYDEVLAGSIKHPLRLAISIGSSRNRYVWPARHAVYSGSPTDGLPMGARLRLRRDWYEANAARFSPAARLILQALRVYGGLVADLASGGLWISGVNDDRWDAGDLLSLQSVPASAFEVLDTIRPRITFTGPNSGRVGERSRFRVVHTLRGDTAFQTNVYFLQSTDGGKNWKVAGWEPAGVPVGPARDGPFDVAFIPPAPGEYLLQAKPYLEWIEPPLIRFRALP